MSVTYENPWLYQGQIFDESLVDDHVGFVYIITNSQNGRKYIGKKLFWATGYRQVKGKRKRIKVQSDWRKYYGSSKELQEELANSDPLLYSREILRLCKSKGALSYYEAKEQFDRDVLLSDEFYNQFIGLKVHAKHVRTAD